MDSVRFGASLPKIKMPKFEGKKAVATETKVPTFTAQQDVLVKSEKAK